MNVLILLFIIALLACVAIFFFVRYCQLLKIARKQHLQIMADALFRGSVIEHINKKGSLGKIGIQQLLKESGINQ